MGRKTDKPVTEMQGLLDRLGWSRRFFGEHIGVTQRTVFRWCHEKPDVVAMKLLRIYCRMLDV